MTRIARIVTAFGLLVALFAATAPAMAQAAKKAPEKERSSPLGALGNSKEPVHIEAGRLLVYDKEQRAVYIGDVVAVQGKSTLRCSKLTIFYDNKKDKDAAPKPAAAADDDKGNSIKKMICDGPVSVVSCTQTATGDHGEYEAATDLIILTGNVVMADGPNVQNGDKMVYNQKTGLATVTSNTPNTGRVGGIFIPGSDATKKGDKNPKKGKEAVAAKAPAKPNGCS